MEAARKVTWGCASDFGSLSRPPPARAAPSDWSHVTASSGRSGRPSGTARIIFARAVGVHATAAAFLFDLLVSPAVLALRLWGWGRGGGRGYRGFVSYFVVALG